MCLGIPMQITEVDGFVARCQAKGVEREVSLFLLADDSIEPGDFVLVHLGNAIRKVSAEDAASSWALFDEMLAAVDA